MAGPLTHAQLIRESLKNNSLDKLLSKEDINELIKGSILPDIGHYYKKFENLTKEFHLSENSTKEIDVDKDISQRLKEIEQDSKNTYLILGTISHLILDKYIHEQMHNMCIDDEDMKKHVGVESYFDINNAKPFKLTELRSKKDDKYDISLIDNLKFGIKLNLINYIFKKSQEKGIKSKLVKGIVKIITTNLLLLFFF